MRNFAKDYSNWDSDLGDMLKRCSDMAGVTIAIVQKPKDGTYIYWADNANDEFIYKDKVNGTNGAIDYLSGVFRECFIGKYS